MSTNVIQMPQRNVPQWSFADRLRKVHRDAHLTIEQMATRLDVGSKAYGAWESGRNTPTDIADMAVRLERATGVPRTWFLGWMNEETPHPDGPGGGQESHLRESNPVTSHARNDTPETSE